MASAQTKKPKSLSDFRAAHDKNYIVPNKIREALKKLGDGWDYEVELMRMAQISVTDLAAFRDQFEDHIVVVGGRNPKRVWVGTVEMAKKMREMV